MIQITIKIISTFLINIPVDKEGINFDYNNVYYNNISKLVN